MVDESHACVDEHGLLEPPFCAPTLCLFIFLSMQHCPFLLCDAFLPCSILPFQLHGSAQLISAVSTRLRPGYCDRIPGLSNGQRRWCERHLELMPAIKHGMKLAMDECQRRMADRRWNCPVDQPQLLTAVQNTRECEWFVRGTSSCGGL